MKPPDCGSNSCEDSKSGSSILIRLLLVPHIILGVHAVIADTVSVDYGETRTGVLFPLLEGERNDKVALQAPRFVFLQWLQNVLVHIIRAPGSKSRKQLHLTLHSLILFLLLQI